jgi:putative membrane protein
MFRSLLAIVAAFALVAAPANAHALNDGEIVAIYDQVNSFDIETALLGAARAESPSVRALAATVARDHIGVRNAASALAREAGIAPMLPPDRLAAALDHEALMADLVARSGADFDRAYIAHELAFHRAAIEAVRTALLPETQDTALQAHFRDVLPHFEHHLAETERVARELGLK